MAISGNFFVTALQLTTKEHLRFMTSSAREYRKKIITKYQKKGDWTKCKKSTNLDKKIVKKTRLQEKGPREKPKLNPRSYKN